MENSGKEDLWDNIFDTDPSEQIKPTEKKEQKKRKNDDSKKDSDYYSLDLSDTELPW